MSTKNVDVFLKVSSETHSLADITKLMGIAPLQQSYNKGDCHGQRTSTRTVWIFPYTNTSSFGFEKQFDVLIDNVTATNTLSALSLIADRSVYLDVAIYFSTAMCSISLPQRILAILLKHGIDLEISCYPTS